MRIFIVVFEATRTCARTHSIHNVRSVCQHGTGRNFATQTKPTWWKEDDDDEERQKIDQSLRYVFVIGPRPTRPPECGMIRSPDFIIAATTEIFVPCQRSLRLPRLSKAAKRAPCVRACVRTTQVFE